ncbi:DUF2207 domain-containing protein [Bacillus salacetis]|uniref:DUF2207 domain-containing protein n=1 Tax=Bacillus salacetis TaxID=2315464 RepID=A0A3A1R7S5_9BACI|nr:DUF2207 domain-containing protein [Bacillus salacetis]RIW38940.1 DUF2207 domain-containing protein [Bacillus salacetis]
MNRFIKILVLLLFLFALGQTAYAKSYSIDEVHIRAWIQPNGNLLVNEVFTYTFNGDYESIRRSIHQENHEGVEWYEAYELINKEAEIGFLEERDLQSLKVQKEGNTYRSPFPISNSTRTFVFAYELRNAVDSYDTYSDLTVPFFNSGSNHDVDLNNVTIDFVFPEEVEPANYAAFYHGRAGNIQEKGPSVVRFTSPVSKMYSLTETRLLFPSSIMTAQEKTEAPSPLKKVIAGEEERRAESALRKAQMKSFNNILLSLAVLLGMAVLVSTLGHFLSRLKGRSEPIDALETDPLLFYLVIKRGKFSHMGFIAGIYSLVEKGLVSVRKEKSTSRFLSDSRSPDETLFFTLKTDEDSLTEMEKKLVSWVFRRKGRNGSASFSMNDLAGATKMEKDQKRHLKKYHSKVKQFKEQEKEWFSDVIMEAKEHGLLRDTWFKIMTRFVPVLILAAILAACYFDQQSTLLISIYTGISGVFLLWGWKLRAKWPYAVFGLISIFTAAQIYNERAYTLLVISAVFFIILLFLVPRHTVSADALGVRTGIMRFKKQLRREGIPAEGVLDKWMIRSMMIKGRPGVKKVWLNGVQDEAVISRAPLTALVMSDQNPYVFIANSWKWSIPPAAPSSGSTDAGYYGGSDGGGGDGGGGAGAD